MACWVAPVVAAELWGVSLGHVLGAIADGTIPSCQEYGFVLVDVAPDGGPPPAARRPEGPPPPTYVVVTEEAATEDPGAAHLIAAAQLAEPADVPAAIADVPWALEESAPVPAPVPAPQQHLPAAADEELPPLDEEEDEKPISHWRQVRSNMGRMRKPPGRTPPAAFAA